jgi:glycosyltransferase involved in cell wall biosynthesis
MIGSGPQKDELVGLAATLALQENVIFIDEVPQEELVAFYSMADIFVLPSIVNENGETEGLGVVLLEAMACGLPVIASNVGGIPDIIKDGETGLLVRQKDARSLSDQIIRLLSDDNLRKEVLINGQNLIKAEFSWEIVTDKFIEIYREVLRRNVN